MIQLRERHHELVAPQSGDSVAVPNDIHQSFGSSPQDLIAREVAKRIELAPRATLRPLLSINRSALRTIPDSVKIIAHWSIERIIRHNRPIASHFHSGALEFSYLGEDLDEAVGEPEETIAGITVWERAAEHFHDVLRGD